MHTILATPVQVTMVYIVYGMRQFILTHLGALFLRRCGGVGRYVWLYQALDTVRNMTSLLGLRLLDADRNSRRWD